MEERSLKVLANDTTFFNKISTTLTKLLIPTRVGLNGMLINMKRNSVLKYYENYCEVKEEDDDTKEENALKRYEESYTLYLESIDKYIMDSVYKKVKTKKATAFEQQALSNYYNVVHLKDDDYNEYKARKQKFLLDLDYENVLNSGKEKTVTRYKSLYIEKNDELYKSILKNYSVKLADGIKEKNSVQLPIYQSIFSTLEDYVKTILPLKLEEEYSDFEKIKDEYDELDRFDIVKLDEKDFLEKNVILLGISRTLFTHSLPLVAAEQCYQKLINDARNLLITTKHEKKQNEVYKTLISLITKYNNKLLSTKVYWENSNERDNYKKLWDEYQSATSDDEREIAILKRELYCVKGNGPKTKKIRQFYKNKLVDFGVMKTILNSCRTLENGKYTRKIKV